MHIYLFQIVFLDASSHLYRRVCPSVDPLVRPSVDWSRFRKKQYFCANDLRGCILDGSHVITSSNNHFIIMRMHRWPYGPSLTSYADKRLLLKRCKDKCNLTETGPIRPIRPTIRPHAFIELIASLHDLIN